MIADAMIVDDDVDLLELDIAHDEQSGERVAMTLEYAQRWRRSAQRHVCFM